MPNPKLDIKTSPVVAEPPISPAPAPALIKDGSGQSQIQVSHQIFRRKPLLVEATPLDSGAWSVKESGRTIEIDADLFTQLYESVSIIDKEGLIDAGLPDYPLGMRIDKDNARLVRVEVVNGRGGIAYWHMSKPSGLDCGFRVVADLVDNIQASHKAGRFVEPFEGKPGTRTWVKLD